MASIHGIGDLGGNDNRNNNNGIGFYRIMGGGGENNDENAVFYQNAYKGDPRKQSFCSLLKDTICPLFSFKSFTFVIIIINTIFFIVTLCVGGIDPSKTVEFLPVKDSVLKKFGALNSKNLTSNIPLNLYIWLTNNFLHLNFLHILYNIFFILILGSVSEYMIKPLKLILIYIACGILGSLFSVLTQPRTFSVGASVSVCAIIGLQFAFMTHKYRTLKKIFGGCGSIFWAFCLAYFTLLAIFNSEFFAEGSDKAVNSVRPLGGLLTGYFFSTPLLKIENDDKSIIFDYKIWRWISIIIIISFTLCGFCCVYLLDSYK